MYICIAIFGKISSKRLAKIIVMIIFPARIAEIEVKIVNFFSNIYGEKVFIIITLTVAWMIELW
jgi:hypothetical protein